MKLCADGIGACGGSDAGGIAATAFSSVLNLLLHSQCLLDEPWPSQATLSNMTSVEIIIVGSGTAGSALAARLAETNLTVLLLEAGGDPPIESIVPGFHPFLLHSKYDWNFTSIDHPDSGHELRLGNHRRQLYAGKLLGGSDSIGHMVYTRPLPSDFDEWADILKDDSWNWNKVLPYFKKTEKNTDELILKSSSYHGDNGEVEITSINEENSKSKEFLKSFKELEFNVVKDENDPGTLGKNRAYRRSYTIKDGRRQSTLTAMFNNVANRKNVYVLKNSLVTKILIKNQTAYGVRVSINGSEWEFHANKEVVVSAGVYNSPKLLLLSGIGPKRHIGYLNHIDLLHDLPVGTNLRQQFNSHVFLAAESDLCPSDKYTRTKYFEVIKYLYNRTGSLSIPNSMNSGADYTLKDSLKPKAPDFSIFPYCVPKNSNYFARCLHTLDYTSDICAKLHSINKKYELFPISVVLRKPKSKGLVRLASHNALHKPLIYSGAFIEEDDLEGFPEVIELVRSLKNTTYFKSKKAFVVDFKLKRCQGLKWLEEVKCTVRNTVHTSPLAAGTVAMGTVLDSRMKVLGIQGLRVVDASAMPTVMPNSAVVMLAERAADFIKEDYGLLEN